MAQGGIKDTSLSNDANLVSYYKGYDTTDSKGTFTLTNEASVVFNPGTVFVDATTLGSAFDFGASNGTKAMTNTGGYGFGAGSISISFWLRLETEVASGEYDLVSVGTSGGANSRVIYVYNGGTRQVRFIRAGNLTQEVDYGTALGTNNYYFITHTYDNTNIIGYVNNVAVGTTAASGTAAATNGCYIGRDITGFDSFTSGLIQDVGLWSRALTSTEVNTLWNASIGGGPGWKSLLGVGRT